MATNGVVMGMWYYYNINPLSSFNNNYMYNASLVQLITCTMATENILDIMPNIQVTINNNNIINVFCHHIHYYSTIRYKQF